jgi:hypothetical protein
VLIFIFMRDVIGGSTHQKPENTNAVAQKRRHQSTVEFFSRTPRFLHIRRCLAATAKSTFDTQN